MNWTDLKIYLSLAQHGSLRIAARSLNLTQPTVARRIRSLEADLGIMLFERNRNGHCLTPAGKELLPEVRALETAALRVEKRSLALLDQLAETVRVEAGETTASILVRGLNDLTDGPKIELIARDPMVPAAGRRAEILIQHGMPEKASGLIRRVGSVDCAIYGVLDFANERTLPLSVEDISTLPWIGFTEPQEHYVTMHWFREQMRDRAPVARVVNSDLMAAAASTGIGVAMLPCFLGNTASRLVRLSAPVTELRADYWTVIEPELAQSVPVRKVKDWIVACFRKQDRISI